MQLPASLVAQGDRHLHFPSIDSTMEEARRRFAPDLTHRLWISAGEQTAGRGRQGRGWASPPGNLHLTLLLPTATPMSDQPKLGFVAGVALARAVAGLLPPSAGIRLKWPNDLLVDGAKVSGLLLEGLGQGKAVAVGIGVNVVAHPPDTPYPTTHLGAYAPGISSSAVFDRLSRALVEEFDSFADGRGFALTRQRWLASAAFRGEQLKVRLGDGEATGIFSDIDADGHLLLETSGGRVRLAAGDVFPLDK